MNAYTMKNKKQAKNSIKKLSILIPAYNESKTIVGILEKIIRVDLPETIKKEIIIIDDCSTDHTDEKVAQVMKSHSEMYIKYIRLKENRGKGYAVRTGITNATGEIIIVQDADLEYDPNDYSILLQPILSGKYKIVYGSRLLNRNNKYSYHSFYWGGRLISLITSLLFSCKITDEPTCYKMFDASVLKSIPLTYDRFGFCPEITAKARRCGYAIKEVPINYYPSSKQEGKKIKWCDGVEAICILFKFRFHNKWQPMQYRNMRKANTAYQSRPVTNRRRLLKNVSFLILAALLVFYAFSKQPGYHWVYFNLLRGNMETIKKYPKLTFEQKMQMKLGTSYEYLLYLKQATPENAVILYPDSKDFREKGSPFTQNIDNKIYATRFLYPRKLILESERKTGKYKNEITHVAIVNGKGTEKLPYPVDTEFQHGVLPLKPQTK